jgi:GDP-L-fucose synthase
MNKNDKIYIAGHNGFVGKSLYFNLKSLGYKNIIFKNRGELDLTNQLDVDNWFFEQKPDYVFLSAAKVGGLYHNIKYPSEFLYENLMIQNNIIHSCYKYKVKKLMFLGSSCIYPKENPIPINENRLLKSELELTNEAYSLAKITGIKLCSYYNKQYGSNFISVMPCNLYGPGDTFDLNKSHVIPAIINKMHIAKLKKQDFITIMGDGKTYREFLFIDDLSRILIELMDFYNENEHINIGSGYDIEIRKLILLIKDVVGYEGEIIYDTSKPNGTAKKLLDSSKLYEKYNIDRPKVSLEDGIKKTYDFFKNNIV